MKYWKTLLVVSPEALLYLLKSGTSVVFLAVPPLRWKGLSKVEDE